MGGLGIYGNWLTNQMPGNGNVDDDDGGVDDGDIDGNEDDDDRKEGSGSSNGDGDDNWCWSVCLICQWDDGSNYISIFQKYTTQVIRHIIRTSECVCSLWASFRWLVILVIQEVQRSLRGSVWWDSRNYFIYNAGQGYQINPLCASCATWHYWSNIIVWGYGLVPAGTKPLPQTMLLIVNWTLNKKITSIKMDNFSSIKMQQKSLSVKLQPFASGHFKTQCFKDLVKYSDTQFNMANFHHHTHSKQPVSH